MCYTVTPTLVRFEKKRCQTLRYGLRYGLVNAHEWFSCNQCLQKSDLLENHYTCTECDFCYQMHYLIIKAMNALLPRSLKCLYTTSESGAQERRPSEVELCQNHSHGNFLNFSGKSLSRIELPIYFAMSCDVQLGLILWIILINAVLLFVSRLFVVLSPYHLNFVSFRQSQIPNAVKWFYSIFRNIISSLIWMVCAIHIKVSRAKFVTEMVTIHLNSNHRLLYDFVMLGYVISKHHNEFFAA